MIVFYEDTIFRLLLVAVSTGVFLLGGLFVILLRRRS